MSDVLDVGVAASSLTVGLGAWTMTVQPDVHVVELVS